MKIVFTVFVVLIFISLLSGVFLFLQFDPNIFRPALEECLSKTVHAQASIKSVEIVWSLSPRLKAEGIEIRFPQAGQPFLRAPRAEAEFSLFYLLKRQIAIKDFKFIEPHFVMTRSEKGEWDFALPAAERKSKVPPRAQVSFAVWSWDLEIQEFEFIQGSLYYADRKKTPFFRYELRDFHGRGKIAENQIDLSISQGKSLTELRVDAEGRLHVKTTAPGFLADFAVEAPFEEESRFQGKISLDQYNAQPVMKGIEGLWNGEFEASGEGLHPEDIRRSLLLKGKLSVSDGRVVARNWAREVLTGLSPIPGFSKLTQHAYADPLTEIADGQDTPFESLTVEVKKVQSKIFFEDFVLTHPNFILQADGESDLMDAQVNFKGMAIYMADFAKALLERVSYMDVLENQTGGLLVPFSWKGDFAEAEARPDLRFIVNRLIQIRGEYLASRGIQRLNEFVEAHQ